jgi:hypothetical protein
MMGATWLAISVADADPTTPPDTSGAPVPGQENGGVDTNEPPESTGRAIARDVLLVPKWLVIALQAPVEGLAWLFDRYQLDDLYYRVFYNNHRTFGIVPSAAFQTGYGLTVGGALLATDLGGQGERLSLNALYGGTYNDILSGWADSGRRFGRLWLRGDGSFTRRPADPFYGIGNANTGPRPPVPVDPLVNPTAFASYMRYQEVWGCLRADMRVFDDVHLIASGSYAQIKYANSTSRLPAIAEIYDPNDLVGFLPGVEHVDGTIGVRWDTRRPANVLETTTQATGWLISGFVSRVFQLNDPVVIGTAPPAAADFWRYGIDLQEYIHLGIGPRMLLLRVLGEGVTGGVNQVPFTELPYLGGDFLRGYTFWRFRDRVAAVGTAQYVWDLSHMANAYVFVDAGRVYSSLESLTLDHMRIGYGVGLALHDEDRSFLAEGYIATSVDGGVQVSVAFTPIFNQRQKWR